MQHILKHLAVFERPKTIVIYGPSIIPFGHFLYGKDVHKHGTYSRYLALSDKLVVEFVIFRFREMLPAGSKHKSRTHSLLPFYISPHQRHSNNTIDKVLEMFFLEHNSMSSISNHMDIGLPTVRRWVTQFKEKASDTNIKLEKYAIEQKPGYRPVSDFVNGTVDTVKSIFKRVYQLCNNKRQLLDYGVISWLNLNLQT